MKDTNNLLDYNQWSSGDYEKTLNNIETGTGQQVQLTQDFAVIGETSCKITRVSNSDIFTDFRVQNNTGSFEASCSILAKGSGDLWAIVAYSDNTKGYSRTRFNSSSKIQNIKCVNDNESEKTVNKLYLRIQLDYSDSYIFIDNNSLKHILN